MWGTPYPCRFSRCNGPLQVNIIAVVTDNCNTSNTNRANIKEAIRLTGGLHICKCFAHSFNLAVKDALKNNWSLILGALLQWRNSKFAGGIMLCMIPLACMIHGLYDTLVCMIHAWERYMEEVKSVEV